MVQPLWRAVWWSYKTKHILTIRFSNCASWCLPKGVENFVHPETCVWMFRANLEATKMFLLRRMDKCCVVWCIQTMKYDSPPKSNELLSYEKTRKNFKHIFNFLKRERSQSEKATYYVIPTIWHSGKSKTMEIARNIHGCQELAGRAGVKEKEHRGISRKCNYSVL